MTLACLTYERCKIMFMRMSIVTILLFVSLAVSGQKLKAFCESGRRTAQERLARGQIYFPRYIVDSSITLRKMLEIDFGIVDALYSEYCVEVETELNCHDSVMLKAISDKWGADFLSKQQQLANRLIKEGKGYITPSSHENVQGIDEMMRKGYADNGIRLKRFTINLIISTSGKIVSHDIHANSAREVTQKEIVIITDALSKYSDNWVPGGINGRPIEMDVSIQIGKDVTMPK
jgi:hypothetical protein